MPSATSNQHPHRHRRWLTALMALLALIHTGAAVRAMQMPTKIAAQVSLIMPLEIVANIAWAALSALVALALVRRRPQAQRYVAWLLVGLVSYNMGRWLIFTKADYERQRLPFLLIVAAFILIVPVAYLIRIQVQPTEIVDNGCEPEN